MKKVDQLLQLALAFILKSRRCHVDYQSVLKPLSIENDRYGFSTDIR